jgi:hypothetical protein
MNTASAAAWVAFMQVLILVDTAMSQVHTL